MREIWSMQDRLERYRGKRALRLLGHPRFRAAYDFYALRADAGDADPEVARFWTELQEAPEDERPARAGVKASASGGKAGAGGAKGKRKRRANGNKPAPEAADSGERDEPEQ
jgi:poly(A) polymerase